MSLDFTAVDLETANGHRGSPCWIGLVRVRDGRVAERRDMLIRPPEVFGHFNRVNTALHGVDARAVEDSPEWTEVLAAMLEFVGNDLVVFFNASFNLGVIRQACVAEEIDWPRLHFFSVQMAARRAYPLPSYRLSFVADQCGFTFEQHYNPLEDAEATARIAVAMASEHQAHSITELAERLTVRMGHIEVGSYSASIDALRKTGLVRPDVNPDADPDHPLYGQVVVLTGGLMSMTRQTAWDQLASAGAVPEKGVTKRTNVLVVGEIDPAVLRPGSDITARAAKAFALQAKGQAIEVMTEDDFLRSL
ncbi:exonuclease domain-containing protein [uncultured Jatrophihabitans sp.]|uniref:exonuclease domain-containing protein n=1 Tax=uncultured Jatrophihabitans sp. TaxID=1610747 RepID=UPI0035CC47A1